MFFFSSLFHSVFDLKVVRESWKLLISMKVRRSKFGSFPFPLSHHPYFFLFFSWLREFFSLLNGWTLTNVHPFSLSHTLSLSLSLMYRFLTHSISLSLYRFLTHSISLLLLLSLFSFFSQCLSLFPDTYLILFMLLFLMHCLKWMRKKYRIRKLENKWFNRCLPLFKTFQIWTRNHLMKHLPVIGSPS